MLIDVSTKKYPNTFTIIDEEDFPVLREYKWHLFSSRYGKKYIARGQRIGPRKENKTKAILLHRVIMNPPEDKCIDHINGNPLDNRKENLRICEMKENTRNRKKSNNCSSRYLGVNKRSDGKMWEAGIRFNGVRTYLGSFKSEEEAALAYNKKAKELFGVFANLNIIKPLEL